MPRARLLAAFLLFATSACTGPREEEPLDEPSSLAVDHRALGGYGQQPPDSPLVSSRFGRCGSRGEWGPATVGTYPTPTIVDVSVTGEVIISGMSGTGVLYPVGRDVNGVCTQFGVMYVHWRNPDGSLQRWDACASGGAPTQRVYGGVTGGRSIDSSCCMDATSTDPCCSLTYIPRVRDRVALTRRSADLVVTPSQSESPRGSTIEITAEANPPTIAGMATPLFVVKHEWTPDMADGGAASPLEQEACETRSSTSCFHVMRRSGTMTVGAMVNGKYLEKTVRLTVGCGSKGCSCLEQDRSAEVSIGLKHPVGVKLKCLVIGGEVQTTLSASGKGTAKEPSCNNDCEDSTSGALDLGVEYSFCENRSHGVSGSLEFSRSLKSCPVCDDTCRSTCRFGGCEKTQMEGSWSAEQERSRPSWRVSPTPSFGPKFELTCGGSLGGTIGGGIKYDSSENITSCQPCEDCSHLTSTLTAGAFAKASCTFGSEDKVLGTSPSACIGCAELKLDVSGGAEGQFGDSCMNRSCVNARLDAELSLKANAKLKVGWWEVSAECGGGLTGCAEANQCGTCSCENCRHVEPHFSCIVTKEVEYKAPEGK